MTPVHPASTETAEHYSWGELCEGWRLLNEGDLSVIQERVPPGAAETRHVHSKARQFFYVLEGTAIMEVGAERVTIAAGQGLHVPPGVAHRFVHGSGADVHFLVISAPTTRGDRVEVHSD
ncbi:MAG: cupin domain-containing protein [Vicinamibacterales bacterium]